MNCERYLHYYTCAIVHNWIAVYLVFFDSLFKFLTAVAYFFSRVLRDSIPRFIGPSVRPSVSQSIRHTLLFLFFLRFLESLPLPR